MNWWQLRHGYILTSGQGEKLEWPKAPELWDRFVYIDPIGGATHVVYEWCGVAGWRFVERG